MSGQREYYVYILTNKSNQVLYIGVTNNLQRRIYEHKKGLIEGFSKRYNLKKLVYYEVAPSIREAIAREKQLKNWHRQWKINLITRSNPQWKDLSIDFFR
jgi:putative endonuclease